MSFTLASRRESFRIREIERVCKTKLEEKHLPSGEEVRQHKEASVLQKIREVMEEANTADCYRAVERFEKETGISAIELAAAFLYEQVGGEPEEIVEEPKVVRRDGERRFGDRRRDGSGSRSGGRFGDRDQRGGRFNDRDQRNGGRFGEKNGSYRLERDGRVHLYYTDRADELQKADVIVLPGSKSTLDDLRELKRNGLAEAVVQAARSGKTVMGICGGYQMMGTEVADPGGVEGTPARLSGLGLLPVHTVIGREKVTRQVEFRFRGSGTLCRGYEIHMGRTVADEAGQSFVPLNRLADGTADGCYVHDRCMGTYIHGILDNPSVLDFLLAPYTEEVACGTTEDYADYKERQYDLLAAHVQRNLDMVKFYRILSSEEVE